MSSTFYYPAIFQKEDEGYSVWVPDIKGCVSQGETFDEAMEYIKKARKQIGKKDADCSGMVKHLIGKKKHQFFPSASKRSHSGIANRRINQRPHCEGAFFYSFICIFPFD